MSEKFPELPSTSVDPFSRPFFDPSHDSTTLPELSDTDPSLSTILPDLSTTLPELSSDSDSDGDDEMAENIDYLAESLRMVLEVSGNIEFKMKALSLMGAGDLGTFKNEVKNKLLQFVEKADKTRAAKANVQSKGVRTKSAGAKKVISKARHRQGRTVHLNLRSPLATSPVAQLLRQYAHYNNMDETEPSAAPHSRQQAATNISSPREQSRPDDELVHLLSTSLEPVVEEEPDEDTLRDLLNTTGELSLLSVCLAPPARHGLDPDESADSADSLALSANI